MDFSTAVEALRADPTLAEKGRERYQALLARSATDMAFRQQLLSDPRAALAEFSGANASDMTPMNIVFIENKADVTIVLPDPVDPAQELSEQELEAVAGGTILLTITAAVGGALLSAGAVTVAYELGKHSS
ncbi:MAG TPA: hypothetical protein VFK13_05005 [Gemmatimonadaceae bacterium]|nr:hypothetical protein [Gemmatimonadaceae bacterium]